MDRGSNPRGQVVKPLDGWSNPMGQVVESSRTGGHSAGKRSRWSKWGPGHAEAAGPDGGRTEPAALQAARVLSESHRLRSRCPVGAAGGDTGNAPESVRGGLAVSIQGDSDATRMRLGCDKDVTRM